MAATGSEAASLADHNQVETAQETLVATAVSKEENRHYSSSDSSSDHGKLKDEGNQYAPIQGAAGHDDNALERTISQMNGGLTDEERAELRIIAFLHRSRTATSNGDLERKDTLAGVTDDDARLNPEKPEFDIYVWARAFMRAMDEDGIRSARAGFAFKDLNVTGSGSALSLQKDVASILMAPFRMKEYVSLGHKPHRQILRNFDGVVKSGEMLVVLGRPGSGCSTFLKTICGELTGLSMDKGSVVHYNGTSPN